MSRHATDRGAVGGGVDPAPGAIVFVVVGVRDGLRTW